MINPVHKLKRRVVYADGRPPHWTPDTVSGWLATGIKDKNDVEIFEGDVVQFGEHDRQGVIVLKDAMFQIEHDDKFTMLGKCKGFIEVEVIGHITEEEHHERN